MAKAKKATKKTAKKAAKPAKAAKKVSKPKAKKTAKPKANAKAKSPKKAAPTRNEPPTDIAARLGRKSGEMMVLEGENPSPDDTLLQEWAYDWFLNAGGFDAIKGSDDANAAEQAAIKQSFSVQVARVRPLNAVEVARASTSRRYLRGDRRRALQVGSSSISIRDCTTSRRRSSLPAAPCSRVPQRRSALVMCEELRAELRRELRDRVPRAFLRHE
jgi:hypothetical protein